VREFKVKLAQGQITEVTLGTPIEGVMKNLAGKTPGPPTSRFATLPPPAPHRRRAVRTGRNPGGSES
jgi:hypothetical protein